jgi:phage anti-repressor protein
MNKEMHPFVKKYPLKAQCNYLVLGTFPPAQKLANKKDRQFNVDYFYGNIASFWKIIQEIYPKNKFSDIQSIREWQEEYSIGISDTILSCKRKNQYSTKDSDLILELTDYNHELKTYVLENEKFLEKIIFTSGCNFNNALYNFKIIMGTDFAKIANKLVDNLPSPSGGSNPSFFNTKMETYGLKEDFYYFVIRHTNDNTVAFVKNSFDAKINSVKGQKVMRIPKGTLKAFKIFMYKQILPKSK